MQPTRLSRTDLKNIVAPTLLIQDENDYITKEHFLEMVDYIPDSEQKIIPNVGHNVLQNAPNSVTNMIINFLNK